MSNTSISKRRVWVARGLAVLLSWYALFEWKIVDYPSHAEGPCYSPNNAYYVTRHQTPWQSTNLSYPAAYGTARLFDRSGRLLYEEETFIDGQGGPQWSGGPKDGSTNEWVVYYQGTEDPGWMFYLPEDPGRGNPDIKCYPRIVE